MPRSVQHSRRKAGRESGRVRPFCPPVSTTRLAGPPWLRTRVLDPDTLAPVASGATGLLCHHDLANAGSVSVVLSEDLGRAVGDDGIEVLGRVAGAAPRGCGLLLADLEAP